MCSMWHTWHTLAHMKHTQDTRWHIHACQTCDAGRALVLQAAHAWACMGMHACMHACFQNGAHELCTACLCQEMPADVLQLLRFTLKSVDTFFRGIASHMWIPRDDAVSCVRACQCMAEPRPATQAQLQHRIAECTTCPVSITLALGRLRCPLSVCQVTRVAPVPCRAEAPHASGDPVSSLFVASELWNHFMAEALDERPDQGWCFVRVVPRTTLPQMILQYCACVAPSTVCFCAC